MSAIKLQSATRIFLAKNNLKTSRRAAVTIQSAIRLRIDSVCIQRLTKQIAEHATRAMTMAGSLKKRIKEYASGAQRILDEASERESKRLVYWINAFADTVSEEQIAVQFIRYSISAQLKGGEVSAETVKGRVLTLADEALKPRDKITAFAIAAAANCVHSDNYDNLTEEIFQVENLAIQILEAMGTEVKKLAEMAEDFRKEINKEKEVYLNFPHVRTNPFEEDLYIAEVKQYCGKLRREKQDLDSQRLYSKIEALAAGVAGEVAKVARSAAVIQVASRRRVLIKAARVEVARAKEVARAEEVARAARAGEKLATCSICEEAWPKDRMRQNTKLFQCRKPPVSFLERVLPSKTPVHPVTHGICDPCIERMFEAAMVGRTRQYRVICPSCRAKDNPYAVRVYFPNIFRKYYSTEEQRKIYRSFYFAKLKNKVKESLLSGVGAAFTLYFFKHKFSYENVLGITLPSILFLDDVCNVRLYEVIRVPSHERKVKLGIIAAAVVASGVSSFCTNLLLNNFGNSTDSS